MPLFPHPRPQQMMLEGSDANKISTTIYSGLDDFFSTISCIVREFLHQNQNNAFLLSPSSFSEFYL